MSKAYQAVTRDFGRFARPIGITCSVLLTIMFLFSYAFPMIGRAFSSSVEEKIWLSQCKLYASEHDVTTKASELGGRTYCVILDPIEEIPAYDGIYVWRNKCELLHGVENYLGNDQRICVKEIPLRELGAREDFILEGQ